MKIPKYIINMIEQAAVLESRKNKLKDAILKYFEVKGIDLTTFIGGSNSDDLEQMILCYIDYGEDSITDIIMAAEGLEE